MKTLFQFKSHQDNDYGSYRVKKIVLLTSWEDRPESFRCGCAHDCCGHAQADVFVTELPFGIAIVDEHHFLNV